MTVRPVFGTELRRRREAAGKSLADLAADGTGSLTMTGDADSVAGDPALVGGLSLPPGRPDVAPDLVVTAAEARFEYVRSLGQVASPAYLLPTVFWDSRMMV